MIKYNTLSFFIRLHFKFCTFYVLFYIYFNVYLLTLWLIHLTLNYLLNESNVCINLPYSSIELQITCLVIDTIIILQPMRYELIFVIKHLLSTRMLTQSRHSETFPPKLKVLRFRAIISIYLCYLLYIIIKIHIKNITILL